MCGLVGCARSKAYVATSSTFALLRRANDLLEYAKQGDANKCEPARLPQ
jgi:hypothetical protein